MVTRPHQQFVSYKLLLKRVTDKIIVSIHLTCQDASIRVQHDLLRPSRDLDLRSNFTLANTMVATEFLYLK